MSSIEKINKILSNRQILYLLLLAVVLSILLHPFGIPLGIAGQTRDVYNYVDKLPQNPKILLDVHYEPAGATELQPMAGAFLRQLITKSPKIVFFTTHNIGPIMFERLKTNFPDVFSKLKYGDDYVLLRLLTTRRSHHSNNGKRRPGVCCKRQLRQLQRLTCQYSKLRIRPQISPSLSLITTSTDPSSSS